MPKMKIDELNTLNSSEVFDYKDFITHYFDTMQISDKQRKQRIDAAEELMDIILYFLVWCEEFPVTDETLHLFENDYREKIFEYAEPDDYFDIYIPLFVNTLVETTLEHKDEEYFTSVERAANVAVNESNLTLGHVELQRAIYAGFKNKTWRTELDERVRPTHAELEGRTIPIDQPFLVGESLMMFPKDQYTFNADPKEVVNCRCVCSYS